MKLISRFLLDEQIKALWGMAVIASVFVSAIVIPYKTLERCAPVDIIYWFVTTIFCLDVLLDLHARPATSPASPRERRRIASVIFRSWLIPDVLAALPLATLLAFDAVKGIPFHEYIPLLRLIKLLKVPVFVNTIRNLSNVPPALMRLVVLLFWFALLAHFLALGWIAIGAAETQHSFADQYIRALYWCITTITTIGYGDYGPDHDSNRQILYTIAAQLCGVGMFSYIIGNVATLIVNMDTTRAEFMSRLEDARNYMRVQRIPDSLQKRVGHYYQYLWETRKGLSNDRFMSELPQTLRLDIALYLNRDSLGKVSLFKDASDILIRAVVDKLDPQVYLPDDWIIRQGEFGNCMYFLCRGSIEVLRDDMHIATLPEGSAFGETALLQGERRNASVRALSFCDVYRLSKTRFDQLREDFPGFDEKVREIMRQRQHDADQGAAPDSHGPADS
jgi:voltage-gated potassium channel